MSRHREMENPAAVVRQDQEYVQHLEANGRHREEVDRDHALQLILQERSPRLRRWLRSAHHVLAHAGCTDVDAEFEQFAVDARRSPKGVVAAHLAKSVRESRPPPWGDRDAHAAISLSKISGIPFGANR